MVSLLIHLFFILLTGLLTHFFNKIVDRDKNIDSKRKGCPLLRNIIIFIIIFLIIIITYNIPIIKEHIDILTGNHSSSSPTSTPVISAKTKKIKPINSPTHLKDPLFITDLKIKSWDGQPYMINPGEVTSFSIAGVSYNKGLQAILSSHDGFPQIEYQIPNGYTCLTGDVGFDDKNENLNSNLIAHFTIYSNNTRLETFKTNIGESKQFNLRIQPGTYIKLETTCTGDFSVVYLNWVNIMIR